MPTWFLSLNGAALLLMGGVMLHGRVRQEGALTSPAKFVGIVWALLCCVVGVGLLLMASGHLTRPGTQPPAPTRAAPEFPVDR